MSLNIAICGYGRVGRLIEKEIGESDGLNFAGVIDRALTKGKFANVDAIIDFSHRDRVLPLVEATAEYAPKCRIIEATSGWIQDKAKVEQIVKDAELFFLCGANFAVETAIFMRSVNHAAEMLDKVGGFDASVLDIHHNKKVDMPSGTARKIADNIVERMSTKDKLLLGMQDRAIESNEVHVAALRSGRNVGAHKVIFDSASGNIELHQQTHDRGAYAHGSILAAQWLVKQNKPGYYSFDDCLNDVLGGKK